MIASGAKDWSGAVEFLRADIKEIARESTAAVVKAINVDVLCAVEIENREVLQKFNAQALASKSFDYCMLIDSLLDPRGIDIGLLSKLPLGSIRTHCYDKDAQKKTIFSRDCLDVELKLPDGKPLHMLCNHLKSKLNTSKVTGADDARRLQQAKRVAEILAGYDLSTDYVIVAGDMNDTPDSAPLQPLRGVTDLYDVLELKFGADKLQRWTYQHGTQLNQIDYLLVSKPLKAAFVDAGIERRGMFCANVPIRFPDVTSEATAASDHGAVWAEFKL